MTSSNAPPGRTRHSLRLETLSEVDAALARLPEWMAAAGPALEEGISLGTLRGFGSATYEPLYALACEMCDEGRFTEALPLALLLAAHEPRHGRFAFLAASCLQRTRVFAQAAHLFGMASLEGEPVALYRMGECLAAMGEYQPARQAFEAARDGCTGDADRWALHQRCVSALDRLPSHRSQTGMTPWPNHN